MSISLDIAPPLQGRACQLVCLPNTREPAASTDLDNSLGGGLGLLGAEIFSFGMQSTCPVLLHTPQVCGTWQTQDTNSLHTQPAPQVWARQAHCKVFQDFQSPGLLVQRTFQMSGIFSSCTDRGWKAASPLRPTKSAPTPDLSTSALKNRCGANRTG